jgi:hypothetical protein
LGEPFTEDDRRQFRADKLKEQLEAEFLAKLTAGSRQASGMIWPIVLNARRRTIPAGRWHMLTPDFAPRRRPAAGSASSISGCRRHRFVAALELDTLTIRIPMRLQRQGGRKLIMTPEGVAASAPKPSRDDTLIKALVRAHRWRRRVESGRAKSIADRAEQEGVSDAYVCRLLPLTSLAPDIVEASLNGR